MIALVYTTTGVPIGMTNVSEELVRKHNRAVSLPVSVYEGDIINNDDGSVTKETAEPAFVVFVQVSYNKKIDNPDATCILVLNDDKDMHVFAMHMTKTAVERLRKEAYLSGYIAGKKSGMAEVIRLPRKKGGRKRKAA